MQNAYILKIDSEAHESIYLVEIIDHKTNGAAVINDDGYTTSNGRRVPRRITVGWKILCKRKDKFTSWVSLKDIKEVYTVQVAD